MTDNSKKPRKLPDRYPREQATMIFGDMAELDHVLELLVGLGEHLSGLPCDTTDKEWGEQVSDPITSLAIRLREAYTAYEQFWQPPGWKPEHDREFISCMEDHHEMRRRVSELESGCLREKNGKLFKAYDPALQACANALYFALLLKQIPGGKDWVDYCINTLSQHLMRYHAASLEVLLGRQAVFSSGKNPGSFSNLHKYLKELYSTQPSGTKFPDFWEAIEAECKTKTINNFQTFVLQEADHEDLYYRDGDKDGCIARATVGNKMPFYRGEEKKGRGIKKK